MILIVIAMMSAYHRAESLPQGFDRKDFPSFHEIFVDMQINIEKVPSARDFRCAHVIYGLRQVALKMLPPPVNPDPAGFVARNWFIGGGDPTQHIATIDIGRVSPRHLR